MEKHDRVTFQLDDDTNIIVTHQGQNVEVRLESFDMLGIIPVASNVIQVGVVTNDTRRT